MTEAKLSKLFKEKEESETGKVNYGWEQSERNYPLVHPHLLELSVTPERIP